jgi:hypothetical protein
MINFNDDLPEKKGGPKEKQPDKKPNNINPTGVSGGLKDELPNDDDSGKGKSIGGIKNEPTNDDDDSEDENGNRNGGKGGFSPEDAEGDGQRAGNNRGVGGFKDFMR